jgi:hypothetical protein
MDPRRARGEDQAGVGSQAVNRPEIKQPRGSPEIGMCPDELAERIVAKLTELRVVSQL